LGGTDNLEAYELYLIAKGQYNDLFSKTFFSFSDKKWYHAVELIDAVIALDPEYALAWALKARELVEAELAYRKALELTTEPLSGKEYSIATFYLSVGNFKRANELFEEMRQNDPLNEEVRSNYFLSFVYLDDIKRAEKEYKRGKDLFGDQWSFGNLYITGLRLGKGGVVSPDAIVFSDSIFDAAKEHLNSPEEGLAELRRIYSNNGNLTSAKFIEISVWAAYFGDPEFAMDALKKAIRINATVLYAVWSPVTQETRHLPRFKEFIKEIGLVDYWNKFGWPDLCRPLGDVDFECD